MRVISTDWDRWIGFSNDPADVDGWCFWIRFGYHGLYIGRREDECKRCKLEVHLVRE